MLSVGGGVLALLLALGIGLLLSRHGRPTNAPPASVGGLVVQMGPPQDAKLDPKQPLRCFVNGQFVGMATLADCAKQNGVATKALDVGIDPNGALAAAGEAGVNLAPLPPSDMPPPDPSAVAEQGSPSASHGPVGDCLRYGQSGWRKVGDNVSLNACVQTLYAGHCEKAGGASYGRWQGQTLRLVPHRVESSNDNMNFHQLVDQTDACGIGDF